MKKPPFIRSPYNYDVEQASNESAYVEKFPSLTVQSQTLDTDINEIVRRVGIGAPMPVNHRIPEYGDYTEITDFRSALAAVNAAAENFMALPASVRAQFENDPQHFLEFATNPQNLEQLRQWGLAVQKPIAAPGAPQAPQTPETPPTVTKNEEPRK